MSKIEDKFLQILRKEKIKFIREKTYSSLRGGRYRFDVYIPEKNVLFEIQGEQHYKYVKKFFKTEKEFKAAKYRDMEKIRFCLAKGISLYIIPFWEIDNIHSAADAFNIKYLARTPFKNESDWNRYNSEKNK